LEQLKQFKVEDLGNLVGEDDEVFEKGMDT
jgi:hypothetical protein